MLQISGCKVDSGNDILQNMLLQSAVALVGARVSRSFRVGEPFAYKSPVNISFFEPVVSRRVATRAMVFSPARQALQAAGFVAPPWQEDHRQ